MTNGIYYFTGSGNTLHVADELRNRLPDSRLIPVVSELYKEVIRPECETLGIVAPLHGMTIPIPVKFFLRRADFSKVQYIYLVIDRGGTRSFALEKMTKILTRKGRKPDASFLINALNNDPKFKDFAVPTQKEFDALDRKIHAKTDEIAVTVLRREPHFDEDTDYIDFPYSPALNRLMERLVLTGMSFAEKTKLNGYYYSDSKCTGCGVCENVCPATKIKLTDGKPLWQKHIPCFFCYACVNYCPAHAVQIKSKIYMKSYTTVSGRYPHPWATWEEIAAQKNET